MLLASMYLIFFLSTITYCMEDPERSSRKQLQEMPSVGQSDNLKTAIHSFKKRLIDKHHELGFEALVYMSGFMGVLRNSACAKSIPILIEKIKELSTNLTRDAETAQVLDQEVLEHYRRSEKAIEQATTLLLSKKISPYLSREGASRDISVFINDAVVEQGLQLNKRSKAIDLRCPTQILVEQISDAFKSHFTQVVQHFSFTEGQLENKERVYEIIAKNLNKKTNQNGQEMAGALINGTFDKHLESIINIWGWPEKKLPLIGSEWQEDFSKGIPIILFFDLSRKLNEALLASKPTEIDNAVQKFTHLI